MSIDVMAAILWPKTEAFNAPKVATLLGNHLGLPTAYSYTNAQYLAGEL